MHLILPDFCRQTSQATRSPADAGIRYTGPVFGADFVAGRDFVQKLLFFLMRFEHTEKIVVYAIMIDFFGTDVLAIGINTDFRVAVNMAHQDIFEITAHNQMSFVLAFPVFDICNDDDFLREKDVQHIADIKKASSLSSMKQFLHQYLSDFLCRILASVFDAVDVFLAQCGVAFPNNSPFHNNILLSI